MDNQINLDLDSKRRSTMKKFLCKFKVTFLSLAMMVLTPNAYAVCTDTGFGDWESDVTFSFYFTEVECLNAEGPAAAPPTAPDS